MAEKMDDRALQLAMEAYHPSTTGQPDRDRLARAITAYLAALSPGSTGSAEGWQDISTAPKDGTIIVWSPMGGGKVFFAQWDDNRYATTPKPYWRFSDERIWGTTAVRKAQPTHWRPLPAPPSAMIDAAGGRDE